MRPGSVLLFICVLAAPAEPLEVPFRSRPADGGFPGEWLTAFSAGARDAGLGNASTALTGGAAAYANPAGIAGNTSGEAVMMVAPLLFSGQYQALSLSHPLSGYDNIGAQFLHLGSGSADRTDSLGRSIGSFNEQNYAFLLSYAQRTGRTISAGATVKALRQSMAGLSASGFGGDLGLQVRPFDRLTAGLSALNVVRPKLRLNEETDTFPVYFRFGAVYRHAMLDRPVTFCADAGTFTPSGGRRLFRAGGGVEIQPLTGDTLFFIRLGANQREYTAGFSVGSGNFLFDYAAAFHELDTMHRFGLTFRYDVISPFDVQRIREERLAALKQEARDWLKAGNLEKSEAAARRIAELDETDRDASAIRAEIAKRRNEAAAAARLAEAKALAREKYSRARELYRSRKYREALAAMEGTADLLKGDTRALGLIIMSRAHVLLENGDYVPALEELRKAVELDPDNREAALIYKRVRDIIGAADAGR